MNKCPFDMVAIGNAITDSIKQQGMPPCKFIVIVVDRNSGKSIASNMIDDESASKLLIEAAMVMGMADLEGEEVGHA